MARLALLLYPAAAPAVAINLFLLGLVAPVLGLPGLSPAASLLLSLPLGIPAAWAGGRWVRQLLDSA